MRPYPRTEMVGLGGQLKTERDRAAKGNYGISDLDNCVTVGRDVKRNEEKDLSSRTFNYFKVPKSSQNWCLPLSLCSQHPLIVSLRVYNSLYRHLGFPYLSTLIEQNLYFPYSIF